MMGKIHQLDTAPLPLEFFRGDLSGLQLVLSDEAKQKVEVCRKFLEQKLNTSEEPVYGINTGFGSLYNRHINKEQLEQLQENLVMSHACGSGPEVSDEIVRLMLFLKIRSLAYGHSGVQVSTVEQLINLFNSGALPVVFEFGSLGASGDLAPLAHLSLPLIGKGSVRFKGNIYAGTELPKVTGLDPIRLKAKEGLALLNGTQFMSAYGVWCTVHAFKLLHLANVVGALSLEAFDGRGDAFDALVHGIRPHHGQVAVAEEISRLLSGSALQKIKKEHVQDPYSFRCIPQVHGATADTINYVKGILETEINSVTDNPNLFPDQERIISGGNFHGQPLALAMDFLAIALAELGNISERRTYQLLSGMRGLPSYLVKDPGVNSGLMILQYTAAGMVSRNKQLATPASVDSIVSSNGQEDHVSMGANAATRTKQVVDNLYMILALELMCAAQALEFRRPSRSSDRLEELVHNFRKEVTFVNTDRVLHDDMVKAELFLRSLNW